MILAIYVTLGVFLLLAARDPIRHLSLIWFTVWSSIVHAVVMAVHSLTDPGQIGHLWGDVAALLLTPAVLGALTPRPLAAPHPTREARPGPAQQTLEACGRGSLYAERRAF